MEEQEEKLYFYMLNVPYPVGVRFNYTDSIGRVLNHRDPYVAISKKGLRDFKRANQIALESGLIREVDEPNLDVQSPNVISDEQAAEIVKNTFTLKKALKNATHAVPVQKLLSHAKRQERPSGTIKLIEKRLADFIDLDDEITDPSMMGGVDNG